MDKTWIFWPEKLHWKCMWKQRGFFQPSKLHWKKVSRNNVDFSISEITSKKYVEMTWKFVKIWSLTYRRNIDIKSTWIRRGMSVGFIPIAIQPKSISLEQICYKRSQGIAVTSLHCLHIFNVKKQRPKTNLKKCYQRSVIIEISLDLKVVFP